MTRYRAKKEVKHPISEELALVPGLWERARGPEKGEKGARGGPEKGGKWPKMAQKGPKRGPKPAKRPKISQ